MSHEATNGNNVRIKWITLTGSLVALIFALLGMIWNSTLAAQNEKDKSQDDSIQAINTKLDTIIDRLGKIEGRLSLPDYNKTKQ